MAGMKLFCSECSSLVEVIEQPMPNLVKGACAHKIKVKTIPFEEAKEGVALCLQNAKALAQSSELLLDNGASTHSFMVLTAYEEMPKCARIIDAAAQNYSTRADMLVEVSIFR